MKTIRFKSFDEFQSQMIKFNEPELINCLLEAVQKGMSKGNKKVSVCDIEIEDEEDIFRLYTEQKDWPTALESCMKAFIENEEYEKCIIVQELQKDYEINKLVTEAQNSGRKNLKK